MSKRVILEFSSSHLMLHNCYTCHDSRKTDSLKLKLEFFLLGAWRSPPTSQKFADFPPVDSKMKKKIKNKKIKNCHL